MAANTVLNYLPRKSFVHRLTGTTKLAFFLLFTFASMITYDTRVLIGLMVVSFAAFRASRIRLREVRFMLVFMLVFLILNNVFIYLFSPEQGVQIYGTRHVVATLFWRYTITWEQLFYTLNISLKYFVALPVAILFISATDPSEFAASLMLCRNFNTLLDLSRLWMIGRLFHKKNHLKCLLYDLCFVVSCSRQIKKATTNRDGFEPI